MIENEKGKCLNLNGVNLLYCIKKLLTFKRKRITYRNFIFNYVKVISFDFFFN